MKTPIVEVMVIIEGFIDLWSKEHFQDDQSMDIIEGLHLFDKLFYNIVELLLEANEDLEADNLKACYEEVRDNWLMKHLV